MRLLIILSALFLSINARAQTIVINPRPVVAPVPAKAQRVTIAVTILNSAPPGMPSEMTSGFAAANQALFSVVDHECDVLAPLLHGDCHLVQMTTNGNTNDRQTFGGQQSNPAISVTANATFEIDQKPPAPLPAVK